METCDACGDVIEAATDLVLLTTDEWDVEARAGLVFHDEWDCLSAHFDSPGEFVEARDSGGDEYSWNGLASLYPATVPYLAEDLDDIEYDYEFEHPELSDIDADEIVAELEAEADEDDDDTVDALDGDDEVVYFDGNVSDVRVDDECDMTHPCEELVRNVSGVGHEKAFQLYENGYTSVEDIREASQADLAECPSIGNALAARIKADVDSSTSDERKFIECKLPDGALYVHTYHPDVEHSRYEAKLDVAGHWKEATGASLWVEELAQTEVDVVTEGYVSELTDWLSNEVADGTFYGPLLNDGTVGYEPDERSIEDWKGAIEDDDDQPLSEYVGGRQ